MDRLQYFQYLKGELGKPGVNPRFILDKLLDALITDEQAAKDFVINQGLAEMRNRSTGGQS